MKAHLPLALVGILAVAPVLFARDEPDDPKVVGRILHSMVWTGREALVWGGGSEGKFFAHGVRIDPDGKDRTVLSDRGAPSARWGHAGVWTGREMIVWGGRSQFESASHREDGARYDPKSDTWRPMAAANAPTARSQMAAVWTGQEMIVWGGFGDTAVAWNTGGRYDPKADKWTPMATTGAPDARVVPQCVWTGKELLVWGGITPGLKSTFRSGGRYDPKTDKWTPMAADEIAPAVWGARAVWTGREMIVWGGSHRNGDDEINRVTRSGGAYDPARDRWRALNGEGAPSARFFHEAVWTGTRMVVWGGGDQGDAENPVQHYDDGGQYDPVRDRWAPLTWAIRPSGRGLHSAVWTGRGMMLFGGSTGGFTAFADAALWVPR